MDKKIKSVLGSILVIGVVTAMMAVGTISIYTDTETSTGNTFTAGTLDLQIWDSGTNAWVDDPNVPTVNDLWNSMVNNLKPGDSGTIVIPIKNAGTIDGYADIHIKNVANNENGIEEPEASAPGENGGEPGELGSAILVNISYDSDGDGSADETLVSGETLDNLECITYTATTTLTGGSTANWIIDLWLPGSVGNKIQGDSVTCDVEFSLNQA